MYEKEIAKKVGVSNSTANVILNDLTKQGLVEKTKKGNMSFYRPALNNPALRQFKIYNNIKNLLPVIKKLTPMSRRIVLFGSCASGKNTERSDIDLFVLSLEKDKLRHFFRDYPKIQAIILNSSEWVSLSKKDKPFYDRISKGIVLWDEVYGS